MQVLPMEHLSPETAFVIEDYPYGYTLRCQRRVWLQYKKGHGYRVMTQTTNPKKGSYLVACTCHDGATLDDGGVQSPCERCQGHGQVEMYHWNSPKAGTYEPIIALYLDDAGHVQWQSMRYSHSAEAMARFITTYGGGLNEQASKVARAMLAYVRAVEAKRAAAQVGV